MDTGSIIGIVGIIVAVVFALYAINDVREQVRQMILLQRNLTFNRVVQDFAWLFLDATGTGHTCEIAKGVSEFSMLAEVLDAAKTNAISKTQIENDALATAKDLVESGYAKWKDDWDPKAVEQALRAWQNKKNTSSVANILGKAKKTSLSL